MKCNFCGKEVNSFRCNVCGAFIGVAEENKPEPEPEQEQESKEINKPGLIKKGMNFSRSLAKHSLNGFRNVDESIQEKRLKICRDCEFYDDSNKTCQKCGCYVRVKVAWASESCPEGKWTTEEIKSKGGIIIPQSRPCGECGRKKT